jgi:hypothetical protein
MCGKFESTVDMVVGPAISEIYAGGVSEEQLVEVSLAIVYDALTWS